MQEIRTCPECLGKGRFIDTPCSKCGGSGQIDFPESLKIKIPVGAEEGMALRIPGHGKPSADPNGISGDLLVIVRTAYDPRFERSGADLWHNVYINVPEAVLGKEIEVETLNGKVNVTIPPGTQNNSILRLNKKGLPVFGGDTFGDLYLRLFVHIPQHLSDKERELYKQLDILSKTKTTY